LDSSRKIDIPHVIKYMGSKKPILDFVINAINNVNVSNGVVCDLFAGSCSISAALRRKYHFISNDIQAYSEVIARTYFSDLSKYTYKELFERIEISTTTHYLWFKENYPDYFFDFSKIHDLKKFGETELKQRLLFNKENFETDFHLFTKYYSGTYWSFEQCVWIDALRKTAESFKDSQIYYALLSSIMYGMSYTRKALDILHNTETGAQMKQ
jgi:adenine-specific DNA-methyltransferase